MSAIEAVSFGRQQSKGRLLPTVTDSHYTFTTARSSEAGPRRTELTPGVFSCSSSNPTSPTRTPISNRASAASGKRLERALFHQPGHARVIVKAWRREHNEERPKKSPDGPISAGLAQMKMQNPLNYPRTIKPSATENGGHVDMWQRSICCQFLRENCVVLGDEVVQALCSNVTCCRS